MSHDPAQSAQPTSAKDKDPGLSFARQRRIAEMSNAPADYATALLGEKPRESGRFLRWQQGLVAIEDWQTSVGVGLSRPDRALGTSLEGWDQRRRRRVVASLRTIRRDLGLENDATGLAAGDIRQRADRATEAVLTRRGNTRSSATKTVVSPPSRQRRSLER